MATSSNDRFCRLVLVLCKGGTKIARGLFEKFYKNSTPQGHCPSPWTIDQFLQANKDTIIAKQTGRAKERMFFPGATGTNIERWDLYMFCFVLTDVCQVTNTVKVDAHALQKLRNKLFHLPEPAIDTDDFDRYILKLSTIYDRSLSEINDPKLSEEINEIFKAGTKGPSVEFTSEMMSIMHQFYSMGDETREVLSQHSKEIKDMKEAIKSLESKLESLFSNRLPRDTETPAVPDTILELHVKNCVSDKEKILSKLLADMYREAVKGKSASQEELPSEYQNKMMEAVRETVERFANQDRSIEGAEQKCVLLRIRCSTVASILSLFDDCIEGNLNEEFRQLEVAIRQTRDFEEVSIEAVIYEDEVWKSLNKIVLSLEDIVAHELSKQFQPISAYQGAQGITKVDLVERVSPTAEDEGRIQHSVRLTIKTGSKGHVKLKSMIKSGDINNSINTLRDEMIKQYNLKNLSIETKLLERDSDHKSGQSMRKIRHVRDEKSKTKRQKVSRERDMSHLSLKKYLVREQSPSIPCFKYEDFQDEYFPGTTSPLQQDKNTLNFASTDLKHEMYQNRSKDLETCESHARERRGSFDSALSAKDSGVETATVSGINSVLDNLYSVADSSDSAMDNLYSYACEYDNYGKGNDPDVPLNYQNKRGKSPRDSQSDAWLIKHGIKLNESYLANIKAKTRKSKNIYETFLEPNMLVEKMRKDPEKYISCVLNLEGSHEAYCIPNVATRTCKKIQRIVVSGRSKIGQAYNEDEVVVEILDNNTKSEKRFGKVLGVLKRNRCSGIKHPVFLCTPDDAEGHIVRPMCKTVPKINILQEESRKKRRTLRMVDIYDYDEYNEILHSPKTEVISQAEIESCIFLVAFISWEANQLYPKGAIIKRFPCGSNLKDGIALLNLKYEILQHFSRNTCEEVQVLLNQTDVSDNIPLSEFTDDSAADITDLCTFTIDRHDSKDLNYAFSIQKEESFYKVGVHIVDVSLYVTKGSPINEDAFQRAFTIYSEGESPRYMLPDHISTELCSLLENKKRPVISIYSVLNEYGLPAQRYGPNVSVEKSFIKCCKNLSYEEAFERITAKYNEDELTSNLKALFCLIKKLREHRLGKSRFVLESNEIEKEDNIERCLQTHIMAEELVVLANMNVSTILIKHKFCLPLVTKLSPNQTDMAVLKEKYGHHLGVLSPLQNDQTQYVSDETIENILATNPNMKMMVTESVWERIEIFPELSAENILNDNIHPIQCVMYQDWLSRHGKTFYECSSDRSDVGSQSFRSKQYCQCTSPTRRFIDLIVQRLIHCLLKNQKQIYSRKDISTICSHVNKVEKNIRSYKEECRNLKSATALQKNPILKNCFIKAVSNSGINVLYSERMHFGCQDIPFNLFDIGFKPQMSKNDNTKLQQVKVAWRKRYYDSREMPMLQQNRKQMTMEGINENVSEKTVEVLNHNRDLLFIKLYDWAKLLSSALGNREKDIRHKISTIAVDNDDVGENDLSTECSERYSFTEFSLLFHIGQPLKIQISAEPKQGIIATKPVLYEMTDSITLCFQHFDDPVLHLSQYASSPAQDQYRSCKEYKEIWMPILSMEAAVGAISNEESFYIKNVKVDIIDETRGKFSIPFLFCQRRNIGFSGVFTEGTESIDEDESRFSYDWLCIRKMFPCNQQDVRYHWIGHAEITDVQKKPKQADFRQKYIVSFKLHSRSGLFPNTTKNERHMICNIDVLRKTEVDRRIESHIKIFPEKGHQLAVQIALKRKQTHLDFERQQIANSIDRDLVLHPAADDPKKRPLPKNNKMQQKAIDMALRNRFMLIQGPPGTGKTYTGIKLLYLFNEINNRLYRKSMNVKKHVLFCGPSNKSVDLVAKWMIHRLGDLCPNFVRIYGKATESFDYPIPGITFSSKGSAIHKADDDLKDVTLHHLVRSKGNLHADEVNAFEERFRAENRRPDPEVYLKYLDALRRATSAEIRKHDVILCTTGVASNPKMLRSASVYQIIIDEAGMCSEPQCMAPILASKAEQVVLIGDHKQLRPVVKCMAAADLGLNKSLFERYATTKDNGAPFIMLDQQYRMNPSLCKFPSEVFYEGGLHTMQGLWSHEPLLNIWPTNNNDQPQTHVLVHVEGTEDVLSVSTNEGNEQSKSNKEEIKIVVKVYRFLIEEHVPATSINIISQYNAQCSEIKEELKKERFENYLVNTVVSSQGGEWDYVIFSTVRSLPDYKIEPNPTLGWCKHNLGFITDENQINVALTRARKGLIIVGNKNLLNCDPVWKKLLRYYEECHCIKSPEEFPPKKRSRQQRIRDSQRQSRLRFGNKK